LLVGIVEEASEENSTEWTSYSLMFASYKNVKIHLTPQSKHTKIGPQITYGLAKTATKVLGVFSKNKTKITKLNYPDGNNKFLSTILY
jgi:uncharacterized protein YdhG (YjbR/CyaY superfamily)